MLALWCVSRISVKIRSAAAFPCVQQINLPGKSAWRVPSSQGEHCSVEISVAGKRCGSAIAPPQRYDLRFFLRAEFSSAPRCYTLASQRHRVFYICG
ncbi:unnamed protein product [Citrullus colocynthis]|uniref:Secreted protein n=1 Tax=Citrullus colocynthis TaxID=252529 RepID=A0ABP0XRS1_9ROSI